MFVGDHSELVSCVLKRKKSHVLLNKGDHCVCLCSRRCRRRQCLNQGNWLVAVMS